MFVHPSKRYRLYIDETGTQTLKQTGIDRYLCLMAVVMRVDIHDKVLTPRLQDIKTDLFGHSPTSPVILHRRDMVKREPPFDILEDERVAFEFNTRWAALVRESQYIAMASAIDKHAHLEKYKVWQYDPYHYCLECLLERYVKWLNRHGFVGDVLVESRGKGPDKRLKAAYKRFYINGGDHLSASVIHARLTSGELKLAMKQEDVAAHQLADSLAHPTLKYMRGKYDGATVIDGFGQQLVKVLLQHRLARHPKTDEIDGWGLKWLPRKTGA